MKKIIVLGAGLVGKAIALDLHKNHQVTSADFNPEPLKDLKFNGVNVLNTNLKSKKNLIKAVKDFDLVIGAVPGHMGYETVKNVIEAGKNMVDISFMPEDPSPLNKLAIKKDLTIVTDCGVAPGMSNIILGFHNKRMKVDKFECLVGGLPVVREWPWEYKAVFSPIDVIEEYTRPARYVVNGNLVTKDALSDAELIQFDKIGTLESWNSDGLRSLIQTMKIPNMIEKTLRYPGTIQYLKVLRESGFFSYEETQINGVKIRPIDLTSKLLFPKWKLKPGEEDYTIMRITIEGEYENKPKTFIYNLLDNYEKSTGTISMARTTGYTCNAVANLILNNNYTKKGVASPENAGENSDNFRSILKYLWERGVNYHITEK